MSERIAALLHTVRVLLGFGRHLAATAQQRSASVDFNPIAACYGTIRLYAILAHLQRGLLRATALEQVLQERAARGHDIRYTEPRHRAKAAPAAPADHPPPGQPAADQPAPRKAQPSRSPGWNDPELFMPTLEELVAQARRRPYGRTLVEICLDLAVVPGFCTGPFWNEVFDSIRLHGGSVVALMQETMRREKAFGQEQDRKPGSNREWVRMRRDALRRVLGFFIGEAANDPFDPVSEQYPHAPADATGPP